MGMFDWYEPDPALDCPVCGSPLTEWQGKDGPCALLVWRQRIGRPVEQRVADECKVGLERFHLPPQFEIYTKCCGGDFWVEAIGFAPDGVWTTTELETAADVWDRDGEPREVRTARLRWLRGGSK